MLLLKVNDYFLIYEVIYIVETVQKPRLNFNSEFPYYLTLHDWISTLPFVKTVEDA